MSTEVAKTLAATDKWPLADRLELLNELWDRLVRSGWQPSIDDALRAELDSRLDDLDANPDNALTWDQVAAQLRLPQ